MSDADRPPEPDRPGDLPDQQAPDPFAGPEWGRARSSRPEAPRPDAAQSDELRWRRERRRRSSYATRKRRRGVLIGAGVLTLALVAAVAWLLYTGLRARTELEAVRSEVRQLRAQIAAGELDAARTTAAKLRTHAREAHELTTGPVWASAAALPWLGSPADSARAITASVDDVSATALPALVEASDDLDPAALRRSDGSIALAPIAAVAPQLGEAADSLGVAVHDIDAAPSSTWLGGVDSARSDLLDQLGRLSNTVNSAHVAAQVVPAMLGQDGPRSYLVGFQNEAEVRGTGGLPGAFAILQVDRGRLRFTRFESDLTLTRQTTGLDFGIDYERLWAGSDPTDDYLDSNVSPHFPYAAQIWVAQWKQLSGQQLDGAITLDPTALSYLLKVTGPAQLPDGSSVTARNAVALTQSTVYQRYGRVRNDERKRFLLTLARTVSRKLIDSKANSTALVRAAAHAVSEHRLLVWSSDPDIERRLATTKIAGVVPETDAPYIGLALNNAAANKLDYYLDASMDVERHSCSGGTREITVTMRFRSEVPDDLTEYTYGRYGERGQPPERGDNLTLVSYYASAGGVFDGVTIDGEKSGAGSGLELGHPVFTVRLGLEPGQQHTIVLHLREPASDTAPVLRLPPMVDPFQVNVHSDGC